MCRKKLQRMKRLKKKIKKESEVLYRRKSLRIGVKEKGRREREEAKKKKQKEKELKRRINRK